ncbi:MAG: hypothetical protein ACRDKL_10970 [Solirubrobacteraceae bacterium]
MPAVNYPRDRRSGERRGLHYRSLPLWLQWFLPFAVAVGVVLAVVLFVQSASNAPVEDNYNSAAAAREQYREDNILVRQQQAPGHATLKAGQSAAAGVRAAVVGYMTRQINGGFMDGPIKRSSCTAVAGGTSTRLVFHCDVTASAQMVTYPFDGVVQTRAGAITYCQRVTPPLPSMNVPVSKRCT